MADLKQVPTDSKLLELLEKAAKIKMTPEEIEAQRRSYVAAEMSWPEPKFKMIDGVRVYESYEDYCNG
jgi:hypothetical protein